MLKDTINKFKDMFKINSVDKKNNVDNKKKIENLVVFIIILIITIIIINALWNSDNKGKENSSQMQNNVDLKLAKTEENVQENKEDDLEQRLESILKNIEGVGNVKVLLTYSESSKTIAMYNEDSTKNDTEEEDNRTEEVEKFHKLLLRKK